MVTDHTHKQHAHVHASPTHVVRVDLDTARSWQVQVSVSATMAIPCCTGSSTTECWERERESVIHNVHVASVCLLWSDNYAEDQHLVEWHFVPQFYNRSEHDDISLDMLTWILTTSVTSIVLCQLCYKLLFYQLPNKQAGFLLTNSWHMRVLMLSPHQSRFYNQLRNDLISLSLYMPTTHETVVKLTLWSNCLRQLTSVVMYVYCSDGTVTHYIV